MRILIILFLFLSPILLKAQEVTRAYTTRHYMEEILKGNPDDKKNRGKLEKAIRRGMKFGTPTPKTIGIIIHNLYENDREKVSAEQVQSQIDALNRDFGLEAIIENHPNDPNGIYAKRAVDTEISFCLPSEDEKGKPIQGINYKEGGATVWSDITAIKKNKDGLKPIQTNKYLNIWVVHLPNDNAGFAQMPWGASNTDGIVIDYRYFGTIDKKAPYNEGKTLTHLVGNYLGLYALWGENRCWDDFVEDTPIHNDFNIGCPPHDHVSTCDGYPTEMTMNFMDGTDDGCVYMFTLGQKQRMHAVLAQTGPRAQLGIEPTVCANALVDEPLAESRNTNSSPTTLSSDQLIVFPNPVSNTLYVQFGDLSFKEKVLLEVSSTDGKIIYSKKVSVQSSTTQEINLNNQIPGIYIIRISNKESEVTKKIVVE